MPHADAGVLSRRVAQLLPPRVPPLPPHLSLQAVKQVHRAVLPPEAGTRSQRRGRAAGRECRDLQRGAGNLLLHARLLRLPLACRSWAADAGRSRGRHAGRPREAAAGKARQGPALFRPQQVPVAPAARPASLRARQQRPPSPRPRPRRRQRRAAVRPAAPARPAAPPATAAPRPGGAPGAGRKGGAGGQPLSLRVAGRLAGWARPRRALGRGQNQGQCACRVEDPVPGCGAGRVGPARAPSAAQVEAEAAPAPTLAPLSPG